MLDAGVSRLIGNIYEGAHSAERLHVAADDLLDRIGGAFGLIATAQCSDPSFTKVQWLNRLGSKRDLIVEEYEGEMQPLDPVFGKVAREPEARLFDSARDVPRELHDIHPYMQWMRARFGSTHWMLAYTPPAASLSFGISVQPKAGQHFSQADRDLFLLAFEHMERAFRLAAAAQPSRLAAPTAWVAADGRLISANAGAEAILRSGDGMHALGGRIEAEHGASRRRLASLISLRHERRLTVTLAAACNCREAPAGQP